jgi:taspase, threonine aspartase, 1
MQQDSLLRGNSQTSTKFGSARKRLREFRENLSSSFRKSQKYTIDTIPFPSIGGQAECGQLLSAMPPILMFPLQDSEAESFSSIMDGATERMFRKNQSPARPANMAAIFVHAGAGYHSTTNEHIHLGACDRFVDVPLLIHKEQASTRTSYTDPHIARHVWQCES